MGTARNLDRLQVDGLGPLDTVQPESRRYFENYRNFHHRVPRHNEMVRAMRARGMPRDRARQDWGILMACLAPTALAALRATYPRTAHKPVLAAVPTPARPAAPPPSTPPLTAKEQAAVDRLAAMRRETVALIDFLTQCPQTCQPGDVIAYAALDEVAGLNVREKRHLLETARMYVLDVHHIVFATQRGDGLMYLGDAQKIPLLATRRKFAYNYARKTLRIARAIDVQALSTYQKHQLVAELSIQSATALAMHAHTAKTITEQGEPQPLLIDPRAYADLFQELRDA